MRCTFWHWPCLMIRSKSLFTLFESENLSCLSEECDTSIVSTECFSDFNKLHLSSACSNLPSSSSAIFVLTCPWRHPPVSRTRLPEASRRCCYAKVTNYERVFNKNCSYFPHGSDSSGSGMSGIIVSLLLRYLLLEELHVILLELYK